MMRLRLAKAIGPGKVETGCPGRRDAWRGGCAKEPFQEALDVTLALNGTWCYM